MISPRELIAKSDKQFFKITTLLLKGEMVFPWIVPFNRKLEGTSFTALSAAILPLHQQSKQTRSKGYTVEWKEKTIEGTKQKLPSKIYYETLGDYLFATGRSKDYSKIINSFSLLTVTFPVLTDWAKDNPAFLLANADKINDLLNVCRYFCKINPPHQLYLRELPIEVHSKFIEENTTALRKLLDMLLPEAWINKDEKDFSSRYFVKKPSVYTQLRVLDESLKPSVGFDELSLTLEDSALLSWQPATVFIIENQACFLSFPKVKNAVAIFGEGFKSRVAKHIPWLANADIYCWFDLDAAGFEMLNIIREYYPAAKSFLMDKETYDQFSPFSVIAAYRKIQLPRLIKKELELYELLQAGGIRLEQERITNAYIKARLEAIKIC